MDPRGLALVPEEMPNNHAGLPFREARDLAQSEFFAAIKSLNQPSPAEQSKEAKKDRWPYPSKYRLGYSVARMSSGSQRPDQVLYGLKIKIQAPAELSKAQFKKIFDRFAAPVEARIPVALSQIRPARLLAAHDVGSEISAFPLDRGHPSGRITMYLRDAVGANGGGEIYALTAAHVLEQAGRQANEGSNVYCEGAPPGDFPTASGIVKSIHPLEINPLREAGPHISSPERSLDAAIIKMAVDAVKKTPKTSRKTIFFDGKARNIGSDIVSVEELSDDLNALVRAWKVRSHTGDRRLEVISPSTFTEVITPSGNYRAATDLIEFEGDEEHIQFGDSGSLIVIEKGARPLGMLIAQGRSARVVDNVKRAAYYAVPLQSIFETAKVSLI